MTDVPDEKWAEYVRTQREWVELDEALWADPTTKPKSAYMNRLARRAEGLAQELSKEPGWHERNELLLQDSAPGVRLAAALNVAEWDIERALNVIDTVEMTGPRGAAFGAHYAAQRLRKGVGPQAAIESERASPTPTHPKSVPVDRMATAEAILNVHGAVMAGGFASALELVRDDFETAAEGYLQIGLPRAAELLRQAHTHAPGSMANDREAVNPTFDASGLEKLDREYYALVPSDEALGTLLDRFMDEGPKHAPG